VAIPLPNTSAEWQNFRFLQLQVLQSLNRRSRKLERRKNRDVVFDCQSANGILILTNNVSNDSVPLAGALMISLILPSSK